MTGRGWLYGVILRGHPAAFRSEFGGEMARDFEDAVQQFGVLAIFRDALVSLVRQWAVRSSSEAMERRAVALPSLLGGQYVAVAERGLTLLDLMQGAVLATVVVGAFGVAIHPATEEFLSVRLHHDAALSRRLNPAPGGVRHRTSSLRGGLHGRY